MQQQQTNSTNGFYWTSDTTNSNIRRRTLFLDLSADFKFREAISLDIKNKRLLFHAQLVFNNGATVPLSVCHNPLINTFLNGRTDLGKMIFAIDQNCQTLTCSNKLNNVRNQQTAQKWIRVWQEDIILRKRSIIALLIVIGIPIDSEHMIMRKILLQKKKLKVELNKILQKTGEKEQYQTQNMEEQTQPAVIYFGAGKNVKIEQVMNKQKTGKAIEGGYFSIQTFDYLIKQGDGPCKQQKLAKKTLRSKRKQTDNALKYNKEKFQKELSIVSSIKDHTYIIKYYSEPINQNDPTNSPDYILMDKYDNSLQEYIYYIGDSLMIPDKIILAKQIVEAVMSLHQSNVIHRDVKPSNFLIDDSTDNKNIYQLKIIDFAESYSKKTKFYKGDYACSHPYSPLQCSEKRDMLGKDHDQPEQGLAKFEIDYWSVGVTIYELFFRKLPLSFSRAFLVDITASWKTQLLLAVDQREKYGLHLVDDIITIICIKMLKFDQEKRMKLTLTKSILIALEGYVNNLIAILFTYQTSTKPL